MESSSTVTRLLAAAAFRNSDGVRSWVLTWLKDPNRAAAPELGLDLSLVSRVAQWADVRERRFTWVFLVLVLTLTGFLLADLVRGALITLVGAAIIWYAKDAWERDTLLSYFERRSFAAERVEKEFTTTLDAGREAALPAADDNLTVYSGFSPFVGAGLDFGGWSFAIATDKAKPDFGTQRPSRFVLNDLYRAIGDAVARLDLPNVDQRDHFFIQGSDVRSDADVLPDVHGRPSGNLPASLAAQYLATSDPRVRHYRWIRMVDWNGDIVLSYFLRCSLRGPMLYVETKRFLLTPLKDSLRKLDNEAPLRIRDLLVRALLAAPLMGLWRMIAAPFMVLGYVSEFWEELWGREAQERRRLIDQNPLWDYGTSDTARQHFASAQYARYFQKTDADFYEKALEKEILGSLIEFLDSCGIDTSDLRERQSTILNHGVIVQGGNIEAGSMAVGTGARSIQKGLRKPAGPSKSAPAAQRGAA